MESHQHENLGFGTDDAGKSVLPTILEGNRVISILMDTNDVDNAGLEEEEEEEEEEETSSLSSSKRGKRIEQDPKNHPGGNLTRWQGRRVFRETRAGDTHGPIGLHAGGLLLEARWGQVLFQFDTPGQQPGRHLRPAIQIGRRRSERRRFGFGKGGRIGREDGAAERMHHRQEHHQGTMRCVVDFGV